MQADVEILARAWTEQQIDRTVPLIAHILFSFKIGGLENGVVNLINHLPPERFRHVIVCITDYSEFRQRIRRPGVECFALHKPPGHHLSFYTRLWRLLRTLRPAIVHTRNLAALDCQVPAALAGVPIRIHGEHGRDVGDLDGSNRKYQWVRRTFKPFVHQYIALSKDLEGYLRKSIHVAPEKLVQLYNGVDTVLFRPAPGLRDRIPCEQFENADSFVVGTVGRMQSVKDQLTLARAFVLAVKDAGVHAKNMRLVMIGDGPLRVQIKSIVDEAGLSHVVWLPGDRDDVAQLLRGLDLFVLPSLAEGISNTILEAMASGLAVVATAVGGNAELVESGSTGIIVPPAQPRALADAILHYLANRSECVRQGRLGRASVERRFSLDSMVGSYGRIYDRLLHEKLEQRKA